ncbi:hypothetical protein CLU79DRAFT_419010 [Phycomyces nitens]|nr:hypothetical protein CLU79DRAFT_419010 [Phycomyces nitens]
MYSLVYLSEPSICTINMLTKAKPTLRIPTTKYHCVSHDLYNDNYFSTRSNLTNCRTLFQQTLAWNNSIQYSSTQSARTTLR